MERRDTARYMAALALAGSFAPSLMARRRREQMAVSVGSAALGAAAGWAGESLVVQLARDRGETAARLTVAGLGAAASLMRLDSARPVVALVGTGARVAGIAALVGWAAPERRRVSGFDPLPIAAAGALALAGQALRASARRRGRPPLPYPCDDYLATTSWELPGLDFEGQRFCAGATTGLATDPVRVFVGVKSAPTVAARCDLAVAELERLGPRARVVVCSATLRGYVNPVPMAAEERFADGDVAHVCVQYHDRRTPFLWRKVPIAGQTHRELLTRLAGHPDLCVYGESLGAWASARDFGPFADRIARLLWVGLPYLSRRGDDERFQVVRTRDLPDVRITKPFVMLERITDPVVLFPGFELLWRRRGAGWKPGISFVQGLLDLIKATRWTADQPAAAGHDYRIELPVVVNWAFGHDRPLAEAEAVGARVLETEAARAAAVRDARQRARSGPSARTGRRRRRSRSSRAASPAARPPR